MVLKHLWFCYDVGHFWSILDGLDGLLLPLFFVEKQFGLLCWSSSVHFGWFGQVAAILICVQKPFGFAMVLVKFGRFWMGIDVFLTLMLDETILYNAGRNYLRANNYLHRCSHHKKLGAVAPQTPAFSWRGSAPPDFLGNIMPHVSSSIMAHYTPPPSVKICRHKT